MKFTLQTLLILPLSLLILGGNGVFAQSNSIGTGQVSHEDAQQTCVVARLEPEPKAVEKAWSKYLKKSYDVKLKGKRPMEAIEISFGAISTQTMDFYTEISEREGGTEMRVFARKGYDDYLSPDEHPNSFAAMRDVTTTFVQQFLQEFYSEQIDEFSGELADLQKDRSKQQEEVEDLKKDNEKLASEIEKLQEEKLENENEVEEIKEKIAHSDELIKDKEGKVNALRSKYNSIPSK